MISFNKYNKSEGIYSPGPMINPNACAEATMACPVVLSDTNVEDAIYDLHKATFAI